MKHSGHNYLPSFAAFIFFPAQIGQDAAVEFINKDVEAAFRAVISCADEPEAVFQVFRSGQPFQEVVGRGFEESGIKCVAIQIDRQRVDLTFQQVLKEVGAQGGFVGDSDLAAGEFHNRSGVEDVRVINVHAQVRVGRPPAPRPNANVVLVMQRGVDFADGALQLVAQPALSAGTLIEQLLRQLLPDLAPPPGAPIDKSLRLLQARLKATPH